MKQLSLPSGRTAPAVFYVTDRRALSGGSLSALLEKIQMAGRAQVDFIQIREKDLSARDLLRLAREAIENARQTALPAHIVIHDRLDVALTAGAAGVHLGEGSLDPQDVVRWCRGGHAPADFLIGVSCHSLEQVRAAERAGADYAFFGPVFDTPSKRRFGPPQGLRRLEEACRGSEIPVAAIGGIEASNAADCMKAGASGIAAIRLFQEAPDADRLASTVAGIRGISSG